MRINEWAPEEKEEELEYRSERKRWMRMEDTHSQDEVSTDLDVVDAAQSIYEFNQNKL